MASEGVRRRNRYDSKWMIANVDDEYVTLDVGDVSLSAGDCKKQLD
jgi:hypothetical protein